jgi:two-component system chemotaxis response regulator CheB
MLRVLVVDDSPTARALLVAVLHSDPGIAVVGEACDGVEAVALAKHLRPHLITMDIHMPRMDGLAATKAIMIEAPTRIVVVTASVAVGEVATSLQALRTGALCVLRKPPSPSAAGHVSEARQLLDMVRAMAHVKVAARVPAAARVVADPSGARVVAIASSTGGPGALHCVLSELAADFPAPVLVVQHMSRGFMPGLVSWLDTNTKVRVKIAEAGEPLVRGCVYLAADDYHLGIARGDRVALVRDEPVRGFRPSASRLFESVAHGFGAGVVAVILTGMGNDGVSGLAAVRRSGGYVLAQDEASSVVFGMPGAAIAAGVADEVLPLRDVGERVAALVAGPLPCTAARSQRVAARAGGDR